MSPQPSDRGPSRPMKPPHAAALMMILVAPPLLAGGGAGPSVDHEHTAKEVVERLVHAHYSELELDDHFSSDLLDRYVELLDPARSYLTAEDVEVYGLMRTRLDEAVRAGDLRPAYAIHKHFQTRRLERLEAQVAAVEDGLNEVNLSDEERLQLDRRELPWAQSNAELDELWRKRLEHEVLDLRIAEQADEDIVETLLRRYRNQLQRAEQVSDDDVFALWMNAVAGGYDPHTNYFPPRAAADFDIQMSLSLEGVGASLSMDGEYVRVERLVPGGPAARAGELKAGDRIAAIAEGEAGEWTDVVGWRLDEIVARVRGKRGSTVKLRVLRGDAHEELSIVRDEVALEDQAASSHIVSIDEDGQSWRVGVIELPTFYFDFAAHSRGERDSRSSARDVAMLVRELEREGVDGLVVDLRGNGGGSLSEAQHLAGLFLGDVPVVQVRDAAGRVQALGGEVPRVYDGPLCVLVDRLSASASEIFAAAIQDHGRGLVLGGRTFGKGTVQTILPLSSGELKLTQAMFFRVNGDSTQHRGVGPDLAFASPYDENEIGESALDEALPWSEVRALRPLNAPQPERLVAHLDRAHRLRAAQDAELVALEARYALYEEQRAEQGVSLREETRRERRESIEARLLAIENRRREAQGEELLESLEDEPRSSSDPSEPDIQAREAARVLVDWLRAVST